ncbi:MAG: NTP transferase domain-containing protein [Gemmatimonadales bacterium]
MTARANPVALVIIGAGAGTRFGGPKAEAALGDGRRFLDAIVETAKNAMLDPIVAVLPSGVAAPAGVRVVVNADPNSEQIASARLGLAQLTNAPVTSALLWPVDHPFVNLESVLAILDAARRTRAHIVVPVHDARRGHPAWFHRDTWRELMTVAQGGARAVIHSDPSRVHEVQVADRGVLRDIDTREDLRDGED